MSKIEVNAVEPQCGTTLTLGASGDTVTIPSGATISNLGTAAGFGSTGEVSWNTTKITADPNTATSGVGYFTDTSSAAFNVTLPASPSAGNVVAVADYANTWDTNNLTVLRNGSNIEGVASDFTCNVEGASITFVYVDATKGWITTNSGNSSQAFGPQFVTATGGTITTSGDYKIHTFTGPGTFCVSNAGNPGGSTTVDYLVVAGGGGAGSRWHGGGGGAGGYRESSGAASGSYSASPLGSGVPALPVSVQGYPITVGGGGAGGGPPGGSNLTGCVGANSIFSTITSTGGGAGLGYAKPVGCGANGGSGGGGGASTNSNYVGGTGNTPPVSPPQGNDGGDGKCSSPNGAGGGGGGATAVGTNVPGNLVAGPGGAGATTSISGSPTAYAGGGSGATGEFGTPGTGGTGGGGNTDAAGTVNTGGGGGSLSTPCGDGKAGGSGIVIIRYKFQ
jgi:hypothetical protein